MTSFFTSSHQSELVHFFLQCCEPPAAVAPPGDVSEGLDAGRMLWAQEVDVMKLLMYYPSIAERLFQYPLKTMEELRAESAALCQSAQGNSSFHPLHTVTPATLSIRFTHYPPIHVSSFPSIPPPQGIFLQVRGTLVRMSNKRVVPFLIRLLCPRCQHVVEYYTSPFDRASTPRMCCESLSCKKEPLTITEQVWMDYAECRLQQPSRGSGELPRSIMVTLDDELSVKCSVGQFVEVIGVMFQRWKQVYPGSRPCIEPVIWATNIMPMEAYRSGGDGVTGSEEREVASNNSSVTAPVGDKRNYPWSFGGSTPEHFFLFFKKKKLSRTVVLTRSISPQLSGLFAPRLAVLLATIGGAPCHTFSTNGSAMTNTPFTASQGRGAERTTGSTNSGNAPLRIRSTIHCLLVGDPSTGKSQLLRFASVIAPRSTCTTGMGSTSAGLTVAATKEGGEWVLEPGALVLSDGGSCIIDELRTIAVADRTSLHEAMEQQTISVAKGGVVTKLSTNCAIIAACNPPPSRAGRGGGPPTVSVGVGGPLLSRFDLVFLLWDNPQKEVDERIADHILWCSGGVPPTATRRPQGLVTVPSASMFPPALSAEEVSKYLCWVKRQYRHVDGPKLSDHAAHLLGCYFDILRARGASPSLDDCIPLTIRMLESLVRLTQAYAKLHLQTVCSIDDAAMAVFLMERSAHGLKCPLGLLDEHGAPLYSSSRSLDNVFLSDSEEDIRMQESVLHSLVTVIFEYASTHHISEGPLSSNEPHWAFLSSSCPPLFPSKHQRQEEGENTRLRSEREDDPNTNNVLQLRRKGIPLLQKGGMESQLSSFSSLTPGTSQKRSLPLSSSSSQLVEHMHEIITTPNRSSSRASTVTVW